MNAIESLRALARYKMHGGYTWAAVMADGALLCTRCVRENYRAVYDETKRTDGAANTEWRCVGVTNSGDSEETEQCAHCGRVLWEAGA